MARTIIGGAIVWPRGRLDGLPVDGPDEDSFTLVVEALERTPIPEGSPHITAIRLVGALPPSRVEDLGAASPTGGSPTCAVEPTLDVAAALRSAVDATDSGMTAIVAIESAKRPPKDRVTRSVVALLVGDAKRRASPEGADVANQDPTAAANAALPRSWEATAPVLEIGSPRRTVAIGEGGGGTDWAWFEGTGPFPWLGGERPPESARIWSDVDAFDRRPTVEPPNLSEGAYVPRPTYLAERAARWRFEGVRCTHCGQLSFPPRTRCSTCGAADGLHPEKIPTRGLTVEATTVVHRGAQPTEFDRQVESTGDYEVVIARATPTVRLTLQLTDAEPGSVKIGDRVDAVLRRIVPMEGDWRYARKAVPARDPLDHRSTRSK